MRPEGVAVLAPALNQDLCFRERVEDLPIEQFVAQLAKRLDVAVLPGAPGRDEQRADADPRQPSPAPPSP